MFFTSDDLVKQAMHTTCSSHMPIKHSEQRKTEAHHRLLSLAEAENCTKATATQLAIDIWEADPADVVCVAVMERGSKTGAVHVHVASLCKARRTGGVLLSKARKLAATRFGEDKAVNLTTYHANNDGKWTGNFDWDAMVQYLLQPAKNKEVDADPLHTNWEKELTFHCNIYAPATIPQPIIVKNDV